MEVLNVHGRSSRAVGGAAQLGLLLAIVALLTNCSLKRPPKPKAIDIAGRYSVVTRFGTAYLTLLPDGRYRQLYQWPDGMPATGSGRWSVEAWQLDWFVVLDGAVISRPWEHATRPSRVLQGRDHIKIEDVNGRVHLNMSEDLSIRLEKVAPS